MEQEKPNPPPLETLIQEVQDMPGAVPPPAFSEAPAFGGDASSLAPGVSTLSTELRDLGRPEPRLPEAPVAMPVQAVPEKVEETVEAITLQQLLEDAFRDCIGDSPEVQERTQSLWRILHDDLFIRSAEHMKMALQDKELCEDVRTCIKGRLLYSLRQQVKKMTDAQKQAKKKGDDGKGGKGVTKEELRPSVENDETSIMRLMDTMRYELEINPKNLSISKTTDEDGSTPLLQISFITKMQWNAFRTTKAVIEHDSISLTEAQIKDDLLLMAGVDPLELFNTFHYPPVPQIRNINGENNKLDPTVNPPVVKKVPQGQSLIQPKNQWLDNKAATAELQQSANSFLHLFPEEGRKELLVGRYQATQKWSFMVNVPSFFAGAVLRYPYDVHNVQCSICFDPIDARKWMIPSEQEGIMVPYYQLNFPACFSALQKPRSLDKKVEAKVEGKVNVYPRVATKAWPPVAHTQTKELLNDFDLKPFSMQIATDPGPTRRGAKGAWNDADDRWKRLEKYFETGVSIKFTLVRHVVAPTLSVLLPLWIIQLMLPFTWLHDLEDCNDVYAYLITLLLTVTAHRSIMEDKLSFVQVFTSPDMEFLKTIVFLAVQMVLVSFFNIASQDIWIEFESSEQYMFAEGIKKSFAVYVVQMIFLLGRILLSLHLALVRNKEVASLDSVTALTQAGVAPEEPISLTHYHQLATLRSKVEDVVLKELRNALERNPEVEFIHDLQREVDTVRVQRKSYFSYNSKLLFCAKEPSDLFRMRLHDHWRKLIDAGNIGAVLYSKELKDTEQIGMEIRYGEKVVYEVLRQIKLEVQFVKPDDAHLRPSKHTEYKKAKLSSGPGARNKGASTWRLSLLLAKSIWYELRHSGCLNCSKICADLQLWNISRRARKKRLRSQNSGQQLL